VGGGGVGVLPDDLAHIVDAKCPGAGSGRGIVERSVKTVGEEEAVLATIVAVPPDDLAGRVDALCKGLVVGQGIVDDGVGATAKEEAVEAAGVRDIPNDLTGVVDPIPKGTNSRQGIVEGGVGIDWHVVILLVSGYPQVLAPMRVDLEVDDVRLRMKKSRLNDRDAFWGTLTASGSWFFYLHLRRGTTVACISEVGEL
jgi:hypothetical protein